MPHMLSGIAGLDYMTGGLYDGDLYVWTGERGEGKSTLCTQILLEAIEQGYNVCAYSGEIPAERFKYSVYLQAAGTNHAKPYTDERTGRISSLYSVFDDRAVIQTVDGIRTAFGALFNPQMSLVEATIEYDVQTGNSSYYFSSIEDLVLFDFFQLLRVNPQIKKCENCGNFSSRQLEVMKYIAVTFKGDLKPVEPLGMKTR